MFKWFKRKKQDKEEEHLKSEKILELEEEKFDEELEEERIEEVVEEVLEEVLEEKIPAEELKEELEEEIQEVSEKIIEDIQKEIKEENMDLIDEDSSLETLDPIEEIVEESIDSLLDLDDEEKIEVEEATVEEVVVEETVDEEKAPIKKPSFFEKLKSGLTKTRDDLTNKLDTIIKSYKKVDEELFEELEEVLITADVGMQTTMNLIDRLRERVKEEKINDPEEVKLVLKDEINKLMEESVANHSLNIEPSPAVILVVGVNGVGKTTTIGKLSHNFKQEGKKVLVAAGDTFRAAAIEQLEEWGNRAGVEFIAHKEGADPAAVIYDGIQAAKSRKSDILICDTAGRLHNKSNLMNELNKIFRVVEREYGEATKEVLLVLDATTGQNAINQAKVFKEVANITGIALTKLDGTAKGGVVIALQSELEIPVKLVGVGEGIEDLQPFNGKDFVEAIFG